MLILAQYQRRLPTDRKDMEKFHDALKTVYGSRTFEPTTLLRVDGSTFLTV